MNEVEALRRMVAPGTPRPGKYRNGVIQIHVTRACDKSCFNCTQGSNLAPLPNWKELERARWEYITPEQFEIAIVSLEGYWGVVGIFGGNPAMHPEFETLCLLARKYFPKEQLGLWCNNPLGKGRIMRQTFNPAVSNLNVHLDSKAYAEFLRDWPESHPFGLNQDSRHSPPYVAIRDVLRKECPTCCGGAGGSEAYYNTSGAERDAPCPECNGYGEVYDEERAWELISKCDINKHWSAMIGVFRGEVHAWFCEIAGAQAMLHQHEPDYPDTGLPIGPNHGYALQLPISPNDRNVRKRPAQWWELPMSSFAHQVRKHCHECGVPLRGYGELAQAEKHARKPTDPLPTEQVSATHAEVYQLKKRDRLLQITTTVEELKAGALIRMTDYMGNAKR